MVPWLRTLVALVEIQGLGLNTHMEINSHQELNLRGVLIPSFGHHWHQGHMWYTYIHVGKTLNAGIIPNL